MFPSPITPSTTTPPRSAIQSIIAASARLPARDSRLGVVEAVDMAVGGFENLGYRWLQIHPV